MSRKRKPEEPEIKGILITAHDFKKAAPRLNDEGEPIAKMAFVAGEEYENDPGNIVPLFQDVFEILKIQKLYDPKREESILAWRFVDKNKEDLMHLWSTPEEEAEFREDFRADKNSLIQGIKNAFHNLKSMMGMLNEVDKNTLLNQGKLSDIDKKKLLRYEFDGLENDENGIPLVKDGHYKVKWKKIDPALSGKLRRRPTPIPGKSYSSFAPTKGLFTSDSKGGRRKTKRRSTTKKSKRNSTKKRKISIKKRKSIKRK
jgi:hypothetical protein